MEATKLFDDLTWDDVVIKQVHSRVHSTGYEAQGSSSRLQSFEDQGGEEHLKGVNV